MLKLIDKHCIFIFKLFGFLLLLIISANLLAKSISQQVPGGLALLHPKELSIERQDVAISPNQVTVSYVFRNNFALDFFQTLAFELPPIKKNEYSHLQNPDDLTVTANGKPVVIKMKKRAISFKGQDVTLILDSLDLSTNPTKSLSKIRNNPHIITSEN